MLHTSSFLLRFGVTGRRCEDGEQRGGGDRGEDEVMVRGEERRGQEVKKTEQGVDFCFLDPLKRSQKLNSLYAE